MPNDAATNANTARRPLPVVQASPAVHHEQVARRRGEAGAHDVGGLLDLAEHPLGSRRNLSPCYEGAIPHRARVEAQPRASARAEPPRLAHPGEAVRMRLCEACERLSTRGAHPHPTDDVGDTRHPPRPAAGGVRPRKPGQRESRTARPGGQVIVPAEGVEPIKRLGVGRLSRWPDGLVRDGRVRSTEQCGERLQARSPVVLYLKRGNMRPATIAELLTNGLRDWRERFRHRRTKVTPHPPSPGTPAPPTRSRS